MGRSIAGTFFDAKKAGALAKPKAVSSTKKDGELSHIKLTEGEDGGHIVEHHFDRDDNSPYKEPKSYPFGKGDGVKLVAHLVKHANIKGVDPMDESARDEKEEEKLSPGIHKRVAADEAKEDKG